MSQDTIVVGDGTGAQVITNPDSFINKALATIASGFSGPSAPPNPQNGQTWIDTSTNPWTPRLYKTNQWVTWASLLSALTAGLVPSSSIGAINGVASLNAQGLLVQNAPAGFTIGGAAIPKMTVGIANAYAQLFIDTSTTGWYSVGPTGSGADKIWTQLDSVPSGAKSAFVQMEVVTINNVGGATTTSIQVWDITHTYQCGVALAFAEIQYLTIYTFNNCWVPLDSNRRFAIFYGAGKTTNSSNQGFLLLNAYIA